MLPRDELFDLISRCKVYLQISNPMTETFGIRGVEAGAFMPAIYYDNGVVPMYKDWSLSIQSLEELPEAMKRIDDEYDVYAQKARDFASLYVKENVIPIWRKIVENFDDPTKDELSLAEVFG